MNIITGALRRHLMSGESINFIASSLKLSSTAIRKHLVTESEPVYKRETQP